MHPFDQLLALLGEVPDPRQAEGKLYKRHYVLLFSILAVVTGGDFFRAIETSITVHRRRLNAAFALRWKLAPAHSAIRYILQGLDPAAVEQVFRRHATGLLDGVGELSRRTIAFDGKTLRRSFDGFIDRKAVQVRHAFDDEACLALAHIEIDEESNEIPAARRLLNALQAVDCTLMTPLIFDWRVTWTGPAVTLHDAACCCRPPARLARPRWTTRTVWHGSEMVTGHPTLSHWDHAENMRGWLRLRTSARIATQLPSPDSTRCSGGNSVESVEQPCGYRRPKMPGWAGNMGNVG